MPSVTVHISFQENLLAEIDAEAARQSRSRSELLREAARFYMKRQQKWEKVFRLGDAVREANELSVDDVASEISAYRAEKP